MKSLTPGKKVRSRWWERRIVITEPRPGYMHDNTASKAGNIQCLTSMHDILIHRKHARLAILLIHRALAYKNPNKPSKPLMYNFDVWKYGSNWPTLYNVGRNMACFFLKQAIETNIANLNLLMIHESDLFPSPIINTRDFIHSVARVYMDNSSSLLLLFMNAGIMLS